MLKLPMQLFVISICLFLSSCSLKPIFHFFEEVIEEDLRDLHELEAEYEHKHHGERHG